MCKTVEGDVATVIAAFDVSIIELQGESCFKIVLTGLFFIVTVSGLFLK
jgi:hypothetical protein